MKKQTPDQLADIYIKMREAIREKEEEIKRIKAQQEKVEQKLQTFLEKENIDSIRTPYGTVTRRVHTSFWTSDWESMHVFLKDNDALHLLEKRVHNSNMKEFLESNPDVAPPGLQTNRKFIVSVRKPPKK